MASLPSRTESLHRADSSPDAAANLDKHLALEGYLKKNKSGHVRYAVLWGEDCDNCLPARLEFYTDKRLFQKRKTPKRVISIGDMAAVAHADRNDAERKIMASSPPPSSPGSMTLPSHMPSSSTDSVYFGFVILLRGSASSNDMAIPLGCERRQECDAWITLLREFITKTPNAQRLGYDHMWHGLKVSHHDLGKKVISSNRLPDARCSFAFNSKEVVLIRPQQAMPFFSCRINLLRNCGAKDKRMYIHCGRHGPHGEGRLYLESQDGSKHQEKVAEQMRAALYEEMVTGVDKKGNPTSAYTPTGYRPMPASHHAMASSLPHGITASTYRGGGGGSGGAGGEMRGFAHGGSTLPHRMPEAVSRQNPYASSYTPGVGSSHHGQPQQQLPLSLLVGQGTPRSPVTSHIHHPGTPRSPVTSHIHHSGTPRSPATSHAQHTRYENTEDVTGQRIDFVRSVSSPCGISPPKRLQPSQPTSASAPPPPLPAKPGTPSSFVEAQYANTSEAIAIAQPNPALRHQLSEPLSTGYSRSQSSVAEASSSCASVDSGSPVREYRPRAGAVSHSLRTSPTLPGRKHSGPGFHRQESAPVAARKASATSTRSDTSLPAALLPYESSARRTAAAAATASETSKKQHRRSSSCGDLQGIDVTDLMSLGSIASCAFSSEPGEAAATTARPGAYALLSSSFKDIPVTHEPRSRHPAAGAAAVGMAGSNSNELLGEYELMGPARNIPRSATVLVANLPGSGSASSTATEQPSRSLRSNTLPVGGSVSSQDSELEGEYEVMARASKPKPQATAPRIAEMQWIEPLKARTGKSPQPQRKVATPEPARKTPATGVSIGSSCQDDYMDMKVKAATSAPPPPPIPVKQRRMTLTAEPSAEPAEAAEYENVIPRPCLGSRHGGDGAAAAENDVHVPSDNDIPSDSDVVPSSDGAIPSSSDAAVRSRSSSQLSDRQFPIEIGSVESIGRKRASQSSRSSCSYELCTSCSSRSSPATHLLEEDGGGVQVADNVNMPSQDGDPNLEPRPLSLYPDFTELQSVAVTKQKFETFSRRTSDQQLLPSSGSIGQRSQVMTSSNSSSHASASHSSASSGGSMGRSRASAASPLSAEEQYRCAVRNHQYEDVLPLERTDRTASPHIGGNSASSGPIPIGSSSGNAYELVGPPNGENSLSWNPSTNMASTDGMFIIDLASVVSAPHRTAYENAMIRAPPADVLPAVVTLQRQASRHGRYFSTDLTLDFVAGENESVDSGFGSRSAKANKQALASSTGSQDDNDADDANIHYQRVAFGETKSPSLEMKSESQATDGAKVLYQVISPTKTQALAKAIQQTHGGRDTLK